MMFIKNIVVFIDDQDGNIYYRIINSYKTKTLIVKTGGNPDKLALNGQWVYYLLADAGDLCRSRFDR
jgi:hypothetical protein